MTGGSLRFNRDTWTGIAGALILLAAMAGVFLYERGQFHEYEVSWSASEAGTMTETGTLAEGDTATFTLVVPEGAGIVANVRASLTWTDNDGEPDTFSLALAPPGESASESDTSQRGSIAISVPVNDQPATTTAAARSAEDAQEQTAQAPTEEGIGPWEVTVTLVSAPGEMLPGGTEVQPDGSNGYTLTLTYDVWQPEVRELTG